MHVDVMGVGEHDLELSERIAWTGRLAHAEGHVRAIGGPVDRRRCNPPPPLVDYLVSGAIEITGITAKLRQHLVDDDRARHAPVGIEFHIFDFVTEKVGLARWLADHGSHGKLFSAVRYIAGGEGRHVDHHARAFEI